MKALTAEQSAAKVKELRKAGYRVKRVKTPSGTVVLVSKKPFVCRASHCAKAKRKPAKKRRRL